MRVRRARGCWIVGACAGFAGAVAACGDDAPAAPSGGNTALDASASGDSASILGEAGLSDGSSDGSVRCSGPACAIAIAVGDSFACALMLDRTVRCWGGNHDGELAAYEADGGPGPNSAGARVIAGLSGIVDLQAGGAHACAMSASGQVTCWGANFPRQSATTAAAFVAPTVVVLPGAAKRLVVGGLSTCVEIVDGRVFCSGYSQDGTLGVADASVTGFNVPIPSEMIGVTKPDDIRSDVNVTCVVVDGGARCVGFNGTLSLGVADAGGARTIPEATQIALPARVARLSQGGYTFSFCASLETGATYCWGNNPLGVAAPTDDAGGVLPTRLDVDNATSIDTSLTHGCALVGGGLRCWGDNTGGELGAAAALGATRVSPTNVPLAAKVVAMGVGASYSCALLETGAVMCWGKNDQLHLGRGDAGLDADLVDPNPAPVAL